MPKRYASSILLLFTIALLAAPAPVESATYKRCGDVIHDGVFVGKIGAKRVSCREARFVVRAFHDLSKPRDFERNISGGKLRGVNYTYRGKRRYLRYDYDSTGFEQARVRLFNRKHGRAIRWFTSS